MFVCANVCLSYCMFVTMYVCETVYGMFVAVYGAMCGSLSLLVWYFRPSGARDDVKRK